MTAPEDERAEGVSAADLFNDALALPPEQQDVFLASRCADDPELLDRLRSMLRIVRAQPGLTLTPVETAPGRALGRYQLLNECGRGGMGVVFRARDNQLSRIVALKILRQGPGNDPEAQRRLLREARILASLHHQNIATLFSLEEAEGVAFFTMELVEGESLAAILERRRLAVGETLRLGESLVAALEYAHQRQVVHRDLKPANIMFLPDGRVKILDFGIARMVDEEWAGGPGVSASVAATTLHGTPAYMSPEQLSGSRSDARSDIWQLGCVLFECLTGRRYRPEGLPEAPHAHPRIIGFGSGAPKTLVRIVERCLAESPEERPQSTAEVRAVFDRLARSRGTRLVRVAVSSGLGLLLAVSALVYFTRPSRPGPLVTVQVEDSNVVRAADGKGRTIWSTAISGTIAEKIWPLKFPCFEDSLALLNKLLFWGMTGSGRSALWTLRPADGRVAWSLPAEFGVVPVNIQATPRFQDARWVSFDCGAERVLAVTVVDVGFYSTSLQFYSEEHQLLGEYLHPGPLFPAGCADLTGDGRSVVVLEGMNSSARFAPELLKQKQLNEQHCACLVLLDSPAIHGQGFPYSEDQPDARDWPGVPRAREAGYIVAPPLSEEVRPLTQTLSVVDDGFIWSLSDGRIFDLDNRLRPTSCHLVINSPAARILAGRPTTRVAYVRDGVVSYVDLPTGS